MSTLDSTHLTPEEFLSGDYLLGGDAVLSGSGQIDGHLFSQGTFSPGNSPGIVNVADFTQAADGVLQIELGGLTAGPGTDNINDGFDQVNVTGTATLDGALEIVLLDDFLPQVGQTFDIMTWGDVSGSFADASGLFAFGDGDLFLKINQLSDRLQLEAVELPGLAVQTMDGAADDALGVYFNKEYFTNAALDPVTSYSRLTLGDYMEVVGQLDFKFSFESITLQTDDLTLADVGEMMTVGIADADAFFGLDAPYLLEWDSDLLTDADNDGDPTNDHTYSSDASGLRVENINGAAVWFDGVLGEYYALNLTADNIQSVGLDGLDVSSDNVSAVINSGKITGAKAAIDFVDSFGAGGLTIATGNGDVTMEFSAPPQYDLQALGATLVVDGFAYVSGDVTFSMGDRETVDVHYDLGGEISGDITDVDMAVMSVGVANGRLFAGYVGNDENYLAVADPGPTLEADELNDTAVGVAINDLSVGFVVMKPDVFLIDNAMPSFYAARIEATQAALVGIDELTLSATGIEARYNGGSNSAFTIDWAASYGVDGYAIATSGDPIIIDYGADPFLGVYIDQATLAVGGFLHLSGAVAIEKGRQETVTVAYDTAGALITGTTEAVVEMFTIGVSNAYGFAGYVTDGGAYVTAADPGPTLEADEVNDSAVGLVLNDIDFGLVLATPHEVISGAWLPSMGAARATVGALEFVGMDTLDLSATGIEIQYNMEGAGTLVNASIDWATSFGDAGFEIATGGDPVVIDYGDDPFLGVYVARGTLAISSFLHVTGAFAFEKGGSADVVVAYDIGTTLNDVTVEFATFGVSNAYGFAGYLGDGGSYLAVDDPGETLDDGEINDSAVGLALNDIDLGLVMASPDSVVADLIMPTMYAGRVTIGSMGLVGIDEFELSASGIEAQFNLSGSGLLPAVIDWQASFGADGFEIATGGAPVVIDYGDDEFIGVYVEKGTLKVSDFLYVTGAFAFEQGKSASVNVSYDLGGIGGTSDGVEVDLINVGVSNAYGFIGYTGGRDYLTVDDPGDTLDDGEVNEEVMGFVLNDVDLGLVMATPHDLIDSSLLPSMYAARLTIGSTGVVGIDGFTLEAEGVEVQFNGSGSNGALGLRAVVDWESTFGVDGYAIPTGGADPIIIDYNDDEFIGVYIDKGTLKISDFLYVTGAFAFEKGATADVTVAYDLGVTLDVGVEFMTGGLTNGYGFIGYIGDGGDYLTVDDPGDTLEAEEVNGTVTGFVLNDVDLGLVMASPESVIDGLVVPNMYAGRLTIGQTGLVGIDEFELSAAGVEVQFNLSGAGINPAVVDWQTSFGLDGFEVATGGDPVIIDYGDDEFIGIYVEKGTLKVSDFLFVTGSFAFEQGKSENVTVAYESHGIEGTLDDIEVDLMTLGMTNVYGFIGYTGGGDYLTVDDPGDTVEIDEINPDAIGFALNDIDLGMVIATPHSLIDSQLLPTMYAARLNVGQAGFLGIDGFELDASGIEVQFNGSGSSGLLTSVVDWESTFGDEGFAVATGGEPIIIDYGNDEFIGLYVERATLRVAEFLYVTGAFAFEKGASENVDVVYEIDGLVKDTLSDVQVEVMTIGMSNAYAFAGYIPDGGDYLTVDDPGETLDEGEINESAVGVRINDLDAGFVLMKPIVPLVGDYAPSMMAASMSAASVGLVGLDGMQIESDEVEIRLNHGSNAWVDFESSFPDDPDGDGPFSAGLAVATGGEPVVIDFGGDEFLGVYMNNARMNLFNAMALRGSFALEKGGGQTVDVITGLPDEVALIPTPIVSVLNDLDVSGGATVSGDLSRIEGLAVETMTIGARDVSGFVGFDADDYFTRDASAEGGWRASSDAVGLAFTDLDLGFAMMTADVNPVFNKYFPTMVAATGDVDFAGLVGLSDQISAEAYNVQLDLNWGVDWFPSADPYTHFNPAVDFASSFPAQNGEPMGMAVATGATGSEPVYLTMDDRIIRASVEDLHMQALGVVQVVGSAAFTMGTTERFTLTDGSQKDMTVMTVGVANASAFVGVNGPYYTDTNGDGRVTADDGVNSSAVGLAVQNLDAGFMLMKTPSAFSQETFLAGKLDMAQAGLVGIDGAVLEARELSFDINTALNLGNAFEAVDFSELDGRHYAIETGDPTSPIRIDFDEFLLKAQGQALLAIQAAGQDILSLDGAFDIELTDDALQIFVDATLNVGSRGSPVLTFDATGLFLAKSGGFAIKLDVDAKVNLLDDLNFDVEYRFQANTLMQDVVYELPETFLSVDGQRTVTIEAIPPNVGVSTPQPYFLLEAEGSLTVASIFELEGRFSFLLAPEVINVKIDAGFEFMNIGATVSGDALLYTSGDAGLVIDLEMDTSLGLPGVSGVFDINANFRLQVNTTGREQLGIEAHSVRASLEELSVRLLDGLLTLEGSGYVDLGQAIQEVHAEMHTDFFGVGTISAEATFDSIGNFDVSLHGSVHLGWSSFGLYGDADFSMSMQNGVFDISGSVGAKIKAFGATLNFPDLEFTYNSEEGFFYAGVHIKLDLGLFKIDKTVKFPVAYFKVGGGGDGGGVEEEEPFYLAGSAGDPTSFNGGVLHLNMGDRGDKRNYQDDDIHEIFTLYHLPSTTKNIIGYWWWGDPIYEEVVDENATTETIMVEYAGKRQIFEGVTGIYAEGGIGSDYIEIKPGVTSDVEFWGGYEMSMEMYNGNQNLMDEELVDYWSNGIASRGSGDHLIYGAQGSDEIETGSGNDVIYTGGSSRQFNAIGDIVDVGDGDDVIHVRDSSLFALDGGQGNDTFIFETDVLGRFSGSGTIKDSSGLNVLDFSEFSNDIDAKLMARTAVVKGLLNDGATDMRLSVSEVRLGSGNNALSLESMKNDVTVIGQDGDDEISAEDIGGNLTVELGEGANSLQAEGVDGAVSYTGGDSVDWLNLEDVLGDVTLELGDAGGGSTIKLDGIGDYDVVASVSITSGWGNTWITGDDITGDLTVFNEDDSGLAGVSVNVDTLGGNALIDAQGAYTSVNLEDVGGWVEIFAGESDDYVTLDNVMGSHVLVRDLGGSDKHRFYDMPDEFTYEDLGEGNENWLHFDRPKAYANDSLIQISNDLFKVGALEFDISKYIHVGFSDFDTNFVVQSFDGQDLNLDYSLEIGGYSVDLQNNINSAGIKIVSQLTFDADVELNSWESGSVEFETRGLDAHINLYHDLLTSTGRSHDGLGGGDISIIATGDINLVNPINLFAPEGTLTLHANRLLAGAPDFILNTRVDTLDVAFGSGDVIVREFDDLNLLGLTTGAGDIDVALNAGYTLTLLEGEIRTDSGAVTLVADGMNFLTGNNVINGTGALTISTADAALHYRLGGMGETADGVDLDNLKADEDLNENGQLDAGEDLNGNGELDSAALNLSMKDMGAIGDDFSSLTIGHDNGQTQMLVADLFDNYRHLSNGHTLANLQVDTLLVADSVTLSGQIEIDDSALTIESRLLEMGAGG
ncbi:hypothetical protein [Magnetofaba australis]|uniref:Uncharacterized protein n=1 Tax=Magnetofaba australis IT-1 TaxID=1434232 RepID=A0A1Y2KBS3_9PROT|nr:hypothetical protein [Magnetofaba australis]OSM07269.1 hypothetical protein MAIT1_04514 [Magnetofaba australis IT-1]